MDLHIHTNNSDGDFTLEEILKQSELKKLNLISITDHNNINVYDILEDKRNLFSGEILVGVELEFCYEGRLFDMLGYGFDIDILKQSEIIKKGFVHSTIDSETNILNKLKSICDKLGIKYDKDIYIPTPNYMANDVLCDNILSIESNKEILDKLGIKDRSTFYRNHFCNPDSPFYSIDITKKYSLEYVTNLIHESGGLCFFAHPFVYKLDNIVDIMDRFVKLGVIDGIECVHRKHSKEQIEFLIEYCNKNNLYKSGGSDYHTIKHNLGYGNNGEYKIDKELIKDWYKDNKKYTL